MKKKCLRKEKKNKFNFPKKFLKIQNKKKLKTNKFFMEK